MMANRKLRYFRGMIGLLVLLGIILFAGSYYMRSKVVQAVQNRALTTSSVILGRAFEITPGISFTGSRIIPRLKRLGYQQVNTLPKHPGEYFIKKPEVYIYLREILPQYDINQKEQLISIQLQEEMIESISDIKFKQDISRIYLEPEILSLLGNSSTRASRPKHLENYPAHLIQALISVEDERFYSHFGIDPWAILRAMYVNYKLGRVVQGGSTITQQLAKNLFLTRKRTLSRKLREAANAVLIETAFSKEQILEFYLNEIFLGQEGRVAIHGFGEAAVSFFGKEASDISLAEAATLVGIIKAPSKYSPRRFPKRAKKRRLIVLNKMHELGVINQEQLKTASEEEIEIRPPQRSRRLAPYFVDYIRKELGKSFNIEELKANSAIIATGLDTEFQQCAQEAVQEGLKDIERWFPKLKRKKQPLQAALISITTSDAQVRAWVGGRNYGANQFDRVSMAKRQPGSAFKPFVYLTALDENLNTYRVARTTSLLLDEPITLEVIGTGIWEPKNYDEKYRGEVTLRTALAKSLNIPTIDLALKVGIENVANTAELFGFGENLPEVPSLALGAGEVTPLELSRAYNTIANGGLLTNLKPITSLSIEDTDKIYRPQNFELQVASNQAVFVLTDIMRSVIEAGTGRSVKSRGFTAPAAGKTGTSNETRDAWFAGFTPRILTVVWVGYDDNKETELTGASGAIPIWTRYMKCVAPMEPELDFIPPEGIVYRKIDNVSGLLYSPECPPEHAITEVFIEGTEPITSCTEYWNRRFEPEPRQEKDNWGGIKVRKKKESFWDVLFN